MKIVSKKNNFIHILAFTSLAALAVFFISSAVITIKNKAASNRNAISISKNMSKRRYAVKASVSDIKHRITNRSGKNNTPNQKLTGKVTKLTKDNTYTNMLFIPTYDGSGQAMHPKVLYFSQKWNGWTYWMAYTPYPKTIDDYENPSIVVSQDGIHWRVPPKLINPVIPAPRDVKAGGHNSDPHLVMRNNIMELWYRYNPGKGCELTNNSISSIYRVTSRDGVNWSSPELIFKSYLNGKKYYFFSPAVLYENGKYKLWFASGNGAVIYTESKDCIKWSDPVSIAMSVPGFCPWHLDVIHSNSNYEMVFCAYPKGQASKDVQSLFYANSVDGLTWSNIKQILKPYSGTKRMDNQQIYRSSLVIVNNMYRLYYSAMNNKYSWHTFLRQGKTIDTLEDVNIGNVKQPYIL